MKLQKHENILKAAAQAFARLGFRKTSMDEIARAAGVAKGTVYLACKGKEDLFYQAVLRDLREWLADLSKLIDPRVPADELLRRCAIAAIRFLESHALVRDLIVGVHHGDLPGWEERLDQLRALGRSYVVEILRLGIRQGRFRSDLDVERTATVLREMEDAGIIFHSRAKRPDESQLIERLEAGLELVLYGLMDRPKV